MSLTHSVYNEYPSPQEILYERPNLWIQLLEAHTNNPCPCSGRFVIGPLLVARSFVIKRVDCKGFDVHPIGWPPDVVKPRQISQDTVYMSHVPTHLLRFFNTHLQLPQAYLYPRCRLSIAPQPQPLHLSLYPPIPAPAQAPSFSVLWPWLSVLLPFGRLTDLGLIDIMARRMPLKEVIYSPSNAQASCTIS